MKILKNFMLAFMLIFVANSQAFAKANIEDESKYLPCSSFKGDDLIGCITIFYIAYEYKYLYKKDVAKTQEGVIKQWKNYKDLPVAVLKRDIDAMMAFLSIANYQGNTISNKDYNLYLVKNLSMTKTDNDYNKSPFERLKKISYTRLIGLHNALLEKTNGQEYLFENREYSMDDFDAVKKSLESVKFRNKDAYTILYETKNAYKYLMVSYKDEKATSTMDMFSQILYKVKTIDEISLMYANIYKALLMSVKDVEKEESVYYKFADQNIKQTDLVISEINRKIAAK